MAKYRVARLAGEVQKEVADILNREIKDPRMGMVSVVAVDIAPDGCSARIYVSPLTSGADKKDIEAALSSAGGYIRRELGKRLKTRVIPELFFQVDESIAYGVRMSHIVEEQVAADEKAAEGRPPIPDGVYKE
ncbi:MAG: 30S ribosome-binding factor RbfA [Firmicutes bacterium]|nr:30S ribosome-binding factor RbfA [Bacillota bacterium]